MRAIFRIGGVVAFVIAISTSGPVSAQYAPEVDDGAPRDEAELEAPPPEPEPDRVDEPAEGSGPAPFDADLASGEDADVSSPPDAPPPELETSEAEGGGVTASLLVVPGGETVGDIEAPPRLPGIPYAIEIGAQLFAAYQATFFEGSAGETEFFHELDLPRVWLWTGLRIGDAMARVLFEGTRTAGEGALIGVGGDSLVVRIREAWAGYRLFDLFEVRAGLVPMSTTPALTDLWALRAVAEIGSRRFELLQPADLGATLRFDIPEGFGSVQVGFYNGEGYRSRELNRGKTFEAFARVHPLAFESGLEPLTLTLGYQAGSVGVGSARSDRFVSGLAWAAARFGVGAEVTYALGLEDRGDREGMLLEGWARAEPFDDVPILFGARVLHFVRELQEGGTENAGTEFTATLGARIVDPLRVFLAFDAGLADSRFGTAQPGFERFSLRLVVEGNLGARFTGAF